MKYINNIISIIMCIMMFYISYSFYTFDSDTNDLLNLQMIWVFFMTMLYFIDKHFPPSLFFKRINYSYMMLSVLVIITMWVKMSIIPNQIVVSIANEYKIDYWGSILISLISPYFIKTL
jgi:hypothetical protein